MSQTQSLGDKQTEAKHGNALDLLGQLVRFPSTSCRFPYNPQGGCKGAWPEFAWFRCIPHHQNDVELQTLISCLRSGNYSHRKKKWCKHWISSNPTSSSWLNLNSHPKLPEYWSRLSKWKAVFDCHHQHSPFESELCKISVQCNSSNPRLSMLDFFRAVSRSWF